MKKVYISIATLLLCGSMLMAQSPANRTAKTTVADVLVQMPAAKQAEYNKLIKELTSPLYQHATVPLLVDNEIFSYSDNVVPIVSVITALLNAVGVALQPKSNLSLEQNEKNWDRFDLYFR